MAKARYGIDPETGYSLCKQGHVLSPDNVTSNHSCKVCKRLRDKTYGQSEQYKACAKKIRDSLVACVVAGKLGIPVASAPPELIEIKRLTIQLGRALKCQKHNNQSQQAA